MVAGNFIDSSHLAHGFVRDVSGAITIFDPPGSSSTAVFGINKKGVVTGDYFKAGQVLGFARTAKGTITSFDAGGTVTIPVAINGSGQITGSVQDATGTHGFLRTP